MTDNPTSEAAGRLERLGDRYDALKPVHYYRDYETYVRVDTGRVTAVLELGVHRGGSLRVWRDYFPSARIFGVDAAPVSLTGDDRNIHVLQADQTDSVALEAFFRENGVDRFDIIIDDCSHIGRLTKESFQFLFDRFLAPGGFYIIEDWSTGYLPHWPDGAKPVEPDDDAELSGRFISHDFGIPGFVKQLIDRTHEIEPSEIASVVVTAAIVAVEKQTPGGAGSIAESTSRFLGQVGK